MFEQEWLRETCGNDFCVLEEYEAIARVAAGQVQS